MTSNMSSADLPRKEMIKMGCVYRRGKRYWIKYSRNGKSYSESSRSENKGVAERLLKLREGEIAQGRTPGITYDRVSIDELAEDYIQDFKINGKKSLYRAERSVKLLKQEMGGLRATEIDTTLVRRYIQRRKSEKAANGTINRELAALKRIYQLAKMCTPAKVAEVPYIPMLKEDNVRTGFFEHKEFEAMMKFLPEYLKPIVRFAYISGCRKGEILSLIWSQVDIKQGIVRLNPGMTKSGEGRTIYLEPELVQMFRAQYKKRTFGCKHVFHVNGKPIGDFRKAWGAACKKAGIPGMLFHDLRRTAVRNMVRAGIPERVAMEISGHKTRAVFDRYNIVSGDDLCEAARKRQVYRDFQTKQLQNSYN